MNGVVARVVRDVFQAANVVHKEAISKLDGMAENEDGNGRVGVDATLDSTSVNSVGSMQTNRSVEGNLKGESV